MDRLEKHIREHRDEFEASFARKEELWENIAKEIQPAPAHTIPLWKNGWVHFAAAACIIGLVAFFALRTPALHPTKTNTICSIDGVSKEFCMQVHSYESDIQQKMNSLSSTNISIPKEVEEEIVLDSPMKVALMNELKKHPDNPKIQEAILKYYKAKLELIERIEDVLKKQDKNMNNETDHNSVI